MIAPSSCGNYRGPCIRLSATVGGYSGAAGSRTFFGPMKARDEARATKRTSLAGTTAARSASKLSFSGAPFEKDTVQGTFLSPRAPPLLTLLSSSSRS